MMKLQKTTEIGDMEKNGGKSPSPSKWPSLIDEDLTSTINALLTEIKDVIANEIKQSIDKTIQPTQWRTLSEY